MTSSWIGALAVIVLVALNAVLVSARTALVNARRGRLVQLMEEGTRGAALAHRVAEDSSRLIATVRVVQTLTRFMTAGLAGAFWVPPISDWLRQSGVPLVAEYSLLEAILILILPGTLAVVLFGELLPEALVLRDAERWAIRLAPAVAALQWLLWPLIGFSLRVTGWVVKPIAGRSMPLITEEEIRTMVDAGEEGGVIEEEEKQMILSIFELGETLVREVMVPRIDMLAIDVDSSLDDVVHTLLESGHSRAPVYEGAVDNIVGLIYAKDLLRVWGDGRRDGALRGLLRPAMFVPEAKKAADLLAELQSQRVHMAVVVDEYGGTAGLVTIEDILEEIVGEIRDEYDFNEPVSFERVGEDEFLFDGGIDLDDVNGMLEADLPKESGETLGGYLYGQLGKVPAAGERLQAGGLEFVIEQVIGRRIRKVRVKRLHPVQPAEEGNRVD